MAVPDSKTCAIIQSSYIPWKGYFDLINSVDEFVLYDDVQFTRRDWRNRNKIKTPKGAEWLTIPVEVKGKYDQKIRETQVATHDWAEKHYLFFKHVYRKAPHWSDNDQWLKNLYERAAPLDSLSDVNFLFINEICRKLKITTKLHWSSSFLLIDGKSERLLSICQQLEAKKYISGPAAKDYLDEGLFNSAGVKVDWADYGGYDEYDQLYPPFLHGVTVMDLILNMGERSRMFLKSVSGKSMVEQHGI